MRWRAFALSILCMLWFGTQKPLAIDERRCSLWLVVAIRSQSTISVHVCLVRIVHWLFVDSFILHTWPTFRCIGASYLCAHARWTKLSHTYHRLVSICAKIKLKTRSGRSTNRTWLQTLLHSQTKILAGGQKPEPNHRDEMKWNMDFAESRASSIKFCLVFAAKVEIIFRRRQQCKRIEHTQQQQKPLMANVDCVSTVFCEREHMTNETITILRKRHVDGTNALALPQTVRLYVGSFVCMCVVTPCCTKVTLMVQRNTFTQSMFAAQNEKEYVFLLLFYRIEQCAQRRSTLCADTLIYSWSTANNSSLYCRLSLFACA